MTKLTLEEQETIFLYNRADDVAEVFTYEPTLKKKLQRLAADHSEIVFKNDNGDGGVTYTLPKKLITINAPRAKRELTQEQREQLRENILKSCHSAKE